MTFWNDLWEIVDALPSSRSRRRPLLSAIW
jgi:hypothetical protein